MKVSPLFVGLGAAALIVAAGSYSFAREKADPPSYSDLELMAQIMTLIDKEYVEPVEANRLIEGALDGALKRLDPHSGYIPPVTFTEQRKAARNEYGGLGIEVVMEGGLVKVNYALEEGPAYAAGIRAGDFITAVEGESVLGKDLDSAVEGMRGLAGDPVKVTVLTGEQSREVTVIRQKVRGRAVRHRVEQGLGYVYIETFNNAKLTQDLEKAINALEDEIGTPLPGLIIDLRGNRGGLLDQSVSVSGLFLDGGEVLSVRGRDATDTERYHAEPGDRLPGVPIVVLVSPGSASAAEIVAGALQDRGRGVVVGRRTFGKGSVQSVIPLPGQKGALRLTTQRYFTPSGNSIQGRGIMPDFLVAAVEDNGELRRRFREDSLPNALTNSLEGDYEERYEDVLYRPEELPEGTDFQLRKAVDILKTSQYERLRDAQSDLD
jgi:carboxyl-terminal processing protease